MTIRIAGAAVLAMVLAACGGGSGSGTEETSGGPGGGTGSGSGEPTGAGSGSEPLAAPLAAAGGVLGNLPAGFAANHDAATDSVTFDDGTDTVTLERLAGSGGATYRVPGTGIRALREETASGGGSAMAVVWRDKGLAGSVYARLAETQMPGGGSAEFSGTYRALFVVDAVTTAEAELTGDATLTADFDAGTISGVISGRMSGSPGAMAQWAGVTLAPAAIADGAFAGTASGGERTGLAPTTATPGSYAGLFTGADGQEVAGAVVIPHVEVELKDTPFGPNTEYGLFVAERAGP